MNNSNIFNFLVPSNNDELSNMKTLDLQEFLYYLNNYYLKLRNKLNFEYSITFGVEIEAEDCKFNIIKNKINILFPNNSWTVKCDETLKNGIEIASPLLHNEEGYFKDLNAVCLILNEYAQIFEHCGGHIHIGAHIFEGKKQYILNLIKLWAVYENIIYRFGYGEFLSNRPEIEVFAKPIRNKLLKSYDKLIEEKHLSIEDIIDEVSLRRKQAINFDNATNFSQVRYRNTIEFRNPNGTLNPVIWQNNINFFVNLIKYAKSDRFDLDLIERRLKTQGIGMNLKLYNEIYLEQALELSDMIFDNNLDKIYFLRQYLKSFEISEKSMKKAKIFTKNS